MNIIHKISDAIFVIEKLFAQIFIVLMLVVLFASVTFRYIMNEPLHWAGEVAIFCLVWVTFIGGSMGIKLDKAAAVTIFTDIIPEKWKRIVYLIGWGIVFAFCIFLLWYSIQWITLPNIALQMSNALQMPMVYPYLSVPVGFFLLSIHSLSKFVENFHVKDRKVIE